MTLFFVPGRIPVYQKTENCAIGLRLSNKFVSIPLGVGTALGSETSYHNGMTLFARYLVNFTTRQVFWDCFSWRREMEDRVGDAQILYGITLHGIIVPDTMSTRKGINL